MDMPVTPPNPLQCQRNVVTRSLASSNRNVGMTGNIQNQPRTQAMTPSERKKYANRKRSERRKAKKLVSTQQSVDSPAKQKDATDDLESSVESTSSQKQGQQNEEMASDEDRIDESEFETIDDMEENTDTSNQGIVGEENESTINIPGRGLSSDSVMQIPSKVQEAASPSKEDQVQQNSDVKEISERHDDQEEKPSENVSQTDPSVTSRDDHSSSMADTSEHPDEVAMETADTELDPESMEGLAELKDENNTEDECNAQTTSMEVGENEAVNPGDTREIVILDDTNEAVNPEKTSKSENSEDTSEIVILDDTNGAVNPEDTNKAVNPEDTNKAVNPEDTNKAVNPEDTNKAVNPEDANKAVNPEDANKAVNPEDTNKAVNPEDANKAVNPEDANKAVNPEDANKAVNPEDTNKAVSPENESPNMGEEDEPKSTNTEVQVQEESAAVAGSSAGRKEENQKEDKSSSASGSKNLWVAGLAANVTASDIKKLFSNHGKVAGVKIVSHAKLSVTRCFAFVMMMTPEDAANCLQHLHRTELNGKLITLKLAKSEFALSNKQTDKSGAPVTSEGKEAVAVQVTGKGLSIESPDKTGAETDNTTSKTESQNKTALETDNEDKAPAEAENKPKAVVVTEKNESTTGAVNEPRKTAVETGIKDKKATEPTKNTNPTSTQSTSEKKKRNRRKNRYADAQPRNPPLVGKANQPVKKANQPNQPAPKKNDNTQVNHYQQRIMNYKRARSERQFFEESVMLQREMKCILEERAALERERAEMEFERERQRREYLEIERQRDELRRMEQMRSMEGRANQYQQPANNFFGGQDMGASNFGGGHDQLPRLSRRDRKRLQRPEDSSFQNMQVDGPRHLYPGQYSQESNFQNVNVTQQRPLMHSQDPPYQSRGDFNQFREGRSNLEHERNRFTAGGGELVRTTQNRMGTGSGGPSLARGSSSSWPNTPTNADLRRAELRAILEAVQTTEPSSQGGRRAAKRDRIGNIRGPQGEYWEEQSESYSRDRLGHRVGDNMRMDQQQQSRNTRQPLMNRPSILPYPSRGNAGNTYDSNRYLGNPNMGRFN